MTPIPHRARATAPGNPEAGISVIELIVALGIFTFVVAIFMSGVVVMTRNTVRSEVTADAGDDLRTVFQRLDKQVRYADAMNFPGVSGTGSAYVEFRTPATVAASGVETCTQWRWVPSTQRLEVRSWRSSAATLPPFVLMAQDVVDDTSVGLYPFEMTPATPQHPRQSLTVTLLVEAVQDREVSTGSTFVARNSSVESPGNTDTNGDGVSDLPACWRSGVRP